jgi:predicted DNA-binding protein
MPYLSQINIGARLNVGDALNRQISLMRQQLERHSPRFTKAKRSVQIAFQLPVELVERLRAPSVRTRVSQAAYFREAIESLLNSYEAFYELRRASEQSRRRKCCFEVAR